MARNYGLGRLRRDTGQGRSGRTARVIAYRIATSSYVAKRLGYRGPGIPLGPGYGIVDLPRPGSTIERCVNLERRGACGLKIEGEGYRTAIG